MKKNKFLILMMLCFVMMLGGCSDTKTVELESSDSNIPLSFSAEFYDNDGGMWYKATGKSFDINPNKVKEYYYDTDGKWTYKYTLSSIVSVHIDQYQVDSCGSTILFVDDRLKKVDIDFGTSSTIDSSNVFEDVDVNTPKALRMRDYITIKYWWKTSDISKRNQGNSKLIVIQSQSGVPICMYLGNEVYWSISENLPKTTEIMIDDMPMYIHRANFAIIDTGLLDMEEK